MFKVQYIFPLAIYDKLAEINFLWATEFAHWYTTRPGVGDIDHDMAEITSFKIDAVICNFGEFILYMDRCGDVRIKENFYDKWEDLLTAEENNKWGLLNA